MNERLNKTLIEEHLDCLEPNDCYANALYVGRAEAMYSNEQRNVRMVLGILSSESGSGSHAWLEIEGIEVDPTATFFKGESYEYTPKVFIPIDDAMQLGIPTISQLWTFEIDPRRHEEYT